ncbi:MAG: DUF115 domain-containing protein [Clostridia bacterium]|nr:DUF115 domain-containing protein [Clostridia bacterium]
MKLSFGDTVIFKLKSSPFIRAVAYPIGSYRYTRGTRKYSSSADAIKLKQWKNKYSGKRCWIVGNGASLKVSDLEHLNKEITFASNRIYHIYEKTKWRPDFYVAFEPEFTKTNSELISEIEVKKARFINKSGKTGDDEKNYWLNCTSKYSLKKQTLSNIEFSDDISVRVNDAYSVTYTILQIAVYMGFSQIYLLGMDHYKTEDKNGNAQHFYKNAKEEFRTPTYIEGIEYGYALASREAKKKNIHIYNATRDGNLEVFERVDIDSILNTIN